jgi:hypothetical protein
MTGLTANSSASTVFGSDVACILEPVVTQGPYYVAGELIREDVREEQGAPLPSDGKLFGNLYVLCGMDPAHLETSCEVLVHGVAGVVQHCALQQMRKTSIYTMKHSQQVDARHVQHALRALLDQRWH